MASREQRGNHCKGACRPLGTGHENSCISPNHKKRSVGQRRGLRDLAEMNNRGRWLDPGGDRVKLAQAGTAHNVARRDFRQDLTGWGPAAMKPRERAVGFQRHGQKCEECYEKAQADQQRYPTGGNKRNMKLGVNRTVRFVVRGQFPFAVDPRRGRPPQSPHPPDRAAGRAAPPARRFPARRTSRPAKWQ